MVAHIAKRIVEFYVKNNAIELTADNIEVYQYGVEVGLSSLCNLLVVFVIGFVFQSLLASVIFLLIFLLIRRHTGGYHADSYLKCNVIFGTVFFLILILGKSVDAFNLTTVLYSFSFLALLGVGCVWKCAPVPNKYKSLTTQQKQKSHGIAVVGYVLTWFMGTLLSLCDLFLGSVVIGTLLSIVILMLIAEKEEVNQNEEDCC